MNPQEVLEFAKKNDAKQLDLRFTDIPSLQHHVSYPMSELLGVVLLGKFQHFLRIHPSSNWWVFEQ